MFGIDVSVRTAGGRKFCARGVGTLAVVLLLFLSVLLQTNTAEAKPEYPGILHDALGMGDCVPTCTFCHTDPLGGKDKLNAYYPLPWSIVLAVEAGRAPPPLDMDFDKDGMSDGAELKAGRSPFVPGDVAICPRYGCGARIAPLRANGGTAAGELLAVGLGISVLLRRVARRSGAKTSP